MIKLENIQHSFENDFKLNIEALSIPSKSTTYIVGASGSGKSTLLKIMAGLDSFDSGEIEIDGFDLRKLAKNSELHKLNMMFMSQELGLWPHMSALEHILFVLQTKNSSEAAVWLDKVQLLDKSHSKPFQLSGGERQRLALARALAVKPKYLFLDEPFASLDLVLADELFEIIENEQKEQEFSLIQISHHTVGLNSASVNILVMDGGRIMQEGSLDNIKTNPMGTWSKKWTSLLTKKS